MTVTEIMPAEDYPPVIPKKGETLEVTWRINNQTAIATREVVVRREK